MAVFFEGAETDIVGTFGEICRMPILNIAPMCDDEVINNLPVAFARYEDGTLQQFTIDSRSEIILPEEGDTCSPAEAVHEIQECEVYVPDQEFISIGGQERRYTEDQKRFCRARSLAKGISPFDSTGRLKVGTPLALNFLAWRVAELKAVVLQHLKDTIWTGDSSNEMEFDGILTQLQNGWSAPGAGGCSAFRSVVLDWATLTDNAGNTANPEDTIVAAQDSIEIHGVTYTGFTGLNFVELLRKIMLRVRDYDLAGHKVNQFVLMVGRGQSECILTAAACLQPCNGCPPMSDPRQRERLEEFLESKVMYLHPYRNTPIRVMESPALGTNVIFGTWQVDGEYAIQLVFRDQEAGLAELDASVPKPFGWETGLPDDAPLVDNPLDPELFEERAFTYRLSENDNCIKPFINFEASIPVYAQHVFYLFQGVDCATLIPDECETTPSVAVDTTADVGGSTTRIDLTMDSDPTCGTTAGDPVRVAFTDGTVLNGVVVSYDGGTNVLRVDFTPVAVNGNVTFGDALTVTCLAE